MDKHHFALDAVSSLNATTCFSSSETTSLQTNVIFVHVVTSIYINCWHIFYITELSLMTWFPVSSKKVTLKPI